LGRILIAMVDRAADAGAVAAAATRDHIIAEPAQALKQPTLPLPGRTEHANVERLSCESGPQPGQLRASVGDDGQQRRELEHSETLGGPSSDGLASLTAQRVM